MQQLNCVCTLHLKYVISGDFLQHCYLHENSVCDCGAEALSGVKRFNQGIRSKYSRSGESEIMPFCGEKSVICEKWQPVEVILQNYVAAVSWFAQIAYGLAFWMGAWRTMGVRMLYANRGRRYSGPRWEEPSREHWHGANECYRLMRCKVVLWDRTLVSMLT